MNVVSNERCININYPPENFEVIAEIIEEQLIYQKGIKTWTHIQNARQTCNYNDILQIYKYTARAGTEVCGLDKDKFVETYDKLRPSSGLITSTPKTQHSKPIFDQVTADMHDTNTVPKMIDESIMLDSIQQQTELNDTNTATKTVDTQ